MWHMVKRLPHRRDEIKNDWKESAACLGQSVNEGKAGNWFPVEQWRIDDHAKKTCAGCTVRDECLELALRVEGNQTAAERVGIWGGKTPAERVALHRQGKKTRRAPSPARRS